MLSENRLRKLAETRHYTQIVDEVLSNGRPITLAFRLRLSDPETLRPAALALALRRLTEISFAVTDTTRYLAEQLLSCCRPSGSFGSIAATALALRALFNVRSQCGLGDLRAEIDAAIGPALDRISQWQDESGMIGDSIDSAICRWQLSDCEPFRSAIRWHDFVLAVEEMPVSRETAALLESAA